MKYYIEIEHPNTGEKIAGELQTSKRLKQSVLIKRVMEFVEEEKICPSWAAEHCMYKIIK